MKKTRVTLYVAQFWGNRDAWVDAVRSSSEATAIAEMERSQAYNRLVIKRTVEITVLKTVITRPDLME